MSNKLALITGGSRGLGRAAALALASQHRDLIVTYQRRAEDAEAVVQEVRRLGVKALSLQLDVANAASFADFGHSLQGALREHWQREEFDFLINNAGIGINTPFVDTTEAQFDQLMNIHLKGAFFLTQALLPLVADGGRIVNVSTGLARFALPGYAAYAAMKGGVEVLTRYLAKELGPRGIAVNVIAPGAMETDFGGGAARDNAEVNRAIASQTALGRVGLPDDIGGAVAALLSDGARWITGQRIEVSGGMFL